MDLQTLRRELDRLGVDVRYCGPYGLIFTGDHSGGLKTDGRRLHYWNDRDNGYIDLKEAMNCLSELPAQSGEAAVRRLLGQLAWNE